MNSRSVNFQTSQEDIFPELQKGVTAGGHTIKTMTPNQTIISEGGRNYNPILIVLLILFCWPVAIIYYFTSKRISLSVNVTTHNKTGSTVTLISNVKYGERIMEYIFSNLQKNEENPEDSKTKEN